MQAFPNIIDQVIKKALPDIQSYSDIYSDELSSLSWSELENKIGHIYRTILRSFLSDPHITNSEYLVLPEDNQSFSKDVTFGAINHRGLFRQNGRATLIEPCGAFIPRTAESVRHDALHHVYMHLVRKSASINQLFLETTSLQSLCVMFGGGGSPRIHVSSDKLHGTIYVPRKFADFLANPSLRKQWRKLIKAILSVSNAKEILDSLIEKVCLPNEYICFMEPQYQPDQLDSIKVIQQWPMLFSQWLKIIRSNGDMTNIEKAGTLFGSWLRSIAWLMFYCQEGVAGRFFYTVRFPYISENCKDVFPECSMSIVTKRKLNAKDDDRFKSIYNYLHDSTSFKSLTDALEKALGLFKKHRLSDTKTLDKQFEHLEKLRRLLEHLYPKDLPADFKRLCFFLKLSRLLVGRRHEGEPLRFCLIHGFGYERINAESKGVIEEFPVPLLPRWRNFKEQAIKAFDNEAETISPKEFIKNLASWIKSNDLQLQRPDIALYFEEEADSEYPLPISLVQIKRLAQKEVHPVGTELELRQALRYLTANNRQTVALVTGLSGLFLFILGKCLLIRCSSTEGWDEGFYFHVTNDSVVLEDQIQLDLERMFTEAFNDRREVAKKASEIVKHLCEALVAMGHGAMFVVRPNEIKQDSPRLKPLNPVWLLRAAIQECDELKHECAVFALMAALDGATELLLPSSVSEPIQFCCRRFAQTDSKDWVWKDGQGGTGDAVLEEDIKNMWSHLIGKGTRHHTALVLSRRIKDALIITVSADGPVTIFNDGKILEPKSKKEFRFAP